MNDSETLVMRFVKNSIMVLAGVAPVRICQWLEVILRNWPQCQDNVDRRTKPGQDKHSCCERQQRIGNFSHNNHEKPYEAQDINAIYDRSHNELHGSLTLY